MNSADSYLLEIKGLKTHFFTDDGVSPAVDGVDYEVRKGETLGVVGESGCGKSVTALSIMRLIHDPPGRIVAGDILFEGQSLLALSNEEMRRIRGNKISMIFQEPMTSLNPVYTIGNQISEALRLHQGLSKKDAHDRSIDMLQLVGIPLPERRVNEHPHQLSGGMRKRVALARAIALDPELLFLDEPTSGLDPLSADAFDELVLDLKAALDPTIVLVTHDMDTLWRVADRVVLLGDGRLLAEGSMQELTQSDDPAVVRFFQGPRGRAAQASA